MDQTNNVNLPPPPIPPIIAPLVSKVKKARKKRAPKLASGRAKLDAQGNPMPKKTNKRGQMISKLMKEKGMSLPDASRYIKENKMYP